MKNLPDRDFWTGMKDRLGSYAESPDDDAWDKISGALPKQGTSNGWRKVAGIVVLFTLGVFSGYWVHHYTAAAHQHETLSDTGNSPSSEAHDDLQQSPADVSEKSSSRVQSTSSAKESISSANDNIESDNENLLSENAERSAKDGSSLNDRIESGNKNDQTPASNQNEEPAQSVLKQQTISRKRDQRIGLRTSDDDLKRDNPNSTSDSGTLSSSIGDKSEMSSAPTKLAAVNTSLSMANSDLMQSAGNRDHENEMNANESKTTNVNDGSTGRQITTPVPSDSAQIAVTVPEKQSEIVRPLEEQKASKKKELFHSDVYFTLTPTLSFQKITPATKDRTEIIGLESAGILSGDRSGLSIDVGIQRVLMKNLEWYAGLSFYHQKQSLTYQYYSSKNHKVESKNGSYIVTPEVVQKTFSYNMYNAGLSSGIFYTIKTVGLRHKLGLGLQFQKGLLGSNTEASYNNAKSSYLNYQLSYRLELPIRPKLDVYLQPTFVHAIMSKESLSEPFTIKPYRAGLGFGVVYHF